MFTKGKSLNCICYVADITCVCNFSSNSTCRSRGNWLPPGVIRFILCITAPIIVIAGMIMLIGIVCPNGSIYCMWNGRNSTFFFITANTRFCALTCAVTCCRCCDLFITHGMTCFFCCVMADVTFLPMLRGIPLIIKRMRYSCSFGTTSFTFAPMICGIRLLHIIMLSVWACFHRPNSRDQADHQYQCQQSRRQLLAPKSLHNQYLHETIDLWLHGDIIYLPITYLKVLLQS